MREGERTYRGFNLLRRDDAELLVAINRGDFNISGFQNKDLRRCLPGYEARQLSHVLKRLRTHGMIKKIGRTYKYYLTRFGRLVSATVLKLREFVVIPSLAHA